MFIHLTYCSHPTMEEATKEEFLINVNEIAHVRTYYREALTDMQAIEIRMKNGTRIVALVSEFEDFQGAVKCAVLGEVPCITV